MNYITSVKKAQMVAGVAGGDVGKARVFPNVTKRGIMSLCEPYSLATSAAQRGLFLMQATLSLLPIPLNVGSIPDSPPRSPHN